MKIRNLWIALTFVIVGSLAVLGYYGWEIYQTSPPVPKRVIAADGQVVFTDDDIKFGQDVWQSTGGQEVGSVWGHGAYVAPDWSADWLHRELVWLLEQRSQKRHGRSFATLSEPEQGALRIEIKSEIRKNTYDPATGDLTISEERAEAIKAVGAHYQSLFGSDPELTQLRRAYAMKRDTVSDPERRHMLAAFFFWASWACATERPGQTVTYTHNWPPEKLIDNVPTSSIITWSLVSIVLLLAGVGALVWHEAVQHKKEQERGEVKPPNEDPLRFLQPTPSMRATLKYFWVVALLMVAQIGFGIVTAHYGVEGDGLFGIPLDQWLPYSVTRTWHTQLGIFWIATAWLATGLFVAPAISGVDPKGQRFGVNLLFTCLLIIVAGSLAGQWFGVQQKLGFGANFWFGHQGLEYVDLGRFWQLFLFAGLFIWLFLMGRALWPVLSRPGPNRHLLALFFVASAAIALFYGAGLMWGRHTNLALIEYWRWWVVHLWVEGFFEVFAAVVVSLLFVRLGLLHSGSATRAVLFATIIFLFGGMIGTFHHLYFTGTPVAVMALGAVFSALEIVPLTLVGFEAYGNLTLSRSRPWVSRYKWPILFFVAVAFWNLVGAGVFGFLINPPIALYYVQGLNTTPVHGHTALFGVYGMLGIGLMLFCLRCLATEKVWAQRWMKISFWSLNGGLMLMVLLSLLPIGVLQAFASMDKGMWFARSAEFLQTDLMQNLRWLRMIGDTLFAVGIMGVAWFVLRIRNEPSVPAHAPAKSQKASTRTQAPELSAAS